MRKARPGVSGFLDIREEARTGGRSPYRSLGHTLLHYALAALAVGVVLWAKLELRSALGVHVPFLLIFGAVTLAAARGGSGPALFATLLGGLAATYFFLPPLHSFALERVGWVQLLLFLAECFLITFLIARRKKVERELELERSKLLRLLQHAPFAAVVYEGPDHVVRFSNAAHEEMTAYRLKPGLPLLDSLPELAGAPVVGILDAVYRDGVSRSVHEFYTPLVEEHSLRDRWFDITMQPIWDASGKVRAVLASAIEVSAHVLARKHLEAAQQERERILTDLRQAIQVRDEFLSIAAHELRTPLTALTLQLESLQRLLGRAGSSGSERFAPKVDKALRQSERLALLNESLLSVSRIRAGGLALQLEPFDLRSLIDESLERMSEVAEHAGVALRFAPGTPVEGVWDRSRLEQVLLNLLTNAFKYGPGAPVDLGLEAREEEVTVSLRDHGIGIASEDQPRIFERFERAVSVKHYGGLGLGLYITQQIVEAHGGRIEVESALGEGACFRLHLPRDARRAQGSATRWKEDEGGSGTPHSASN